MKDNPLSSYDFSTATIDESPVDSPGAVAPRSSVQPRLAPIKTMPEKSDLASYDFSTAVIDGGQAGAIAPPKADPWEITKGVSSGIDLTQGLLQGAGALAADVVGWDSARDSLIESYRANTKEAQANAPRIQRIEDIQGANDFADWALGTIGQLAPTVVTMIGTGGFGGLLAKAVAKKAISKFEKRLLEKGVRNSVAEKALKKAALSAQKDVAKAQLGGAAAGSIAMETGEIYGDVASEGDTGARAIISSLIGGTAAGMLDVIVPVLGVARRFGFAGELKKKIAEKLSGMKMPTRVGLLGGGAAVTESSMETLQTAIEEATKAFIQERGLPEDIGSMLKNAGAAGLLGGGTMGAVGGIPGGPAKEKTPAQPPAAQPEEGAVDLTPILDEVYGGPSIQPEEITMEGGVPEAPPQPAPEEITMEGGAPEPALPTQEPFPSAKGLDVKEGAEVDSEIVSRLRKKYGVPEPAEPAPSTEGIQVDELPVEAIEGRDVATKQEIDAAANEAATSPLNDLDEPSDPQKRAGKYKMGHPKINGLDISIENPKGSVRTGTSPQGKKWSQKMANHYGYIKRSEGADGDQIDVFLGDNAEDSSLPVFIVDQRDPGTLKFDEHKVILGAKDEKEARATYLANYEKGWQGIRGVRQMTLDEFKTWVKEGDTTKPVAASDARRKIDLMKEKVKARKPVTKAAPEEKKPEKPFAKVRKKIAKRKEEKLAEGALFTAEEEARLAKDLGFDDAKAREKRQKLAPVSPETKLSPEAKLDTAKPVKAKTTPEVDIKAEALAKKKGIAAEKQGKADYTVSYEIQEPAGKGDQKGKRDGDIQPGAPVQRSLDLFVAEDKPAPKKVRIRLATKVKQVRTGTFNIGLDSILTPEDAAHVASPLRKEAQESFVSIITDSKDRPITVIRHYIGTVDGSMVIPRDVLGAIHAVEGAANVWLAHNHPAGIPTPSQADHAITEKLDKLFTETGVTLRGAIVVAPGGKASTIGVSADTDIREFNIPPKRRLKKLDVKERRYSRIGKLHPEALERSSVALKVIKEISQGESGIALLDNRHRAVGFVPMLSTDLGFLRTGKVGRGASRLYKAISDSNAMAMIGYFPESTNDLGFRNLGTFAGSMEVRLLELFDKGGSRADRGILEEGGGAFFSKGSVPAGSRGIIEPSEYRGLHTSPDPESGAPLHDLTGGGTVYPDDIYSNKAIQYYGHGIPLDRETIAIIHRMKGKPNGKVTVYRAIPDDVSVADKILDLENQKAAILRRGRIPRKVDTDLSKSEYYDKIYDELEELYKLPEETQKERVKINTGDWVTISKGYAKEHGDSTLEGKYKIIQKTVMAKQLFTNGDSIHEFGYWPKAKTKLLASRRSAEAQTKTPLSKGGKARVTIASKQLTKAFEELYGKTTPFEEVALSDDESKVVRRVGGAFGKTIVVVRGGREDFDAVVIPGIPDKIFIHENASQPALALLGHELTHTLRLDRPDLYKALHDVAKEELQGTQKYKDWLQRVLEQDVSTSLVEEEMIADFAGSQFADPIFWQKVAERNPSKFSELVSAIKAFIDKLLRRMKIRGLRGTQHMKDVERVQDVLAEVMARYAQEGGKGGVEAGVRMSTAEKLFAPLTLEFVKEKGGEITPEGNIKVFHGTSKKNANAIRKTGELKGFPFFGLDKKTAEKFARQTGGSIEIMQMTVNPDHVIPTGGYLSARLEGMKLGADGVYSAVGADPRISYSAKAGTYYSALLQAARNLKQAKGSPEQMLAMLKKSKDVKQDEISWLGLEEEFAGKKSITKQELIDFVSVNQVDVQTVVKGATDKLSKNERSELKAFLEDVDYLGFDSIADALNDIGGHEDWVERWDVSAESSIFIELGNKYRATVDSTKFATYQLPGAKKGSYREVLLALPQKTPTDEFDLRVVDPIDEKGTVAERNWRILDSNDNLIEAAGTLDQINEKLVNHYWLSKKHSKEDYKGGHYDEPNILAHVRYNERTDAEGKRVLFIEELQSDWGAKARKEGFQRKLKKDDFEIQSQEKGYRIYVKPREAYYGDPEGGSWFSNKAQANEMVDTLLGEPVSSVGIPAAPFVGKTESWVLLAMKNMIRYAAENGFDSVSWTTGEQQADRYDLSKQVDRIEYKLNDDGTADFHAIALDGFAAVMSQQSATKAEVADRIGKEAANKIFKDSGIEDESFPDGFKALVGENLKVGGEGMKKFYDKMLPSIVNKYVRKWGARVGETVVPSEKTGKEYVAVAENGQEVAFDTEREADEWLDAHSEQGLVREREVTEGKSALKVHSLPITESMRNSAMQGVPLFSKRGEPEGEGVGNLAKAIRKDVLAQYVRYAKETEKDIAEYSPDDPDTPLFFQRDKPILLSFDEWVKEDYPNNPNIQFKKYDSPFLNSESVENIVSSYVELRRPNTFLYDNLPTRHQHTDSAHEDGWSASLLDDISYVFSQPYLEEIAKDLGLEPYFLTIESAGNSGITGRTTPYEINIRSKEITEFKGEPAPGSYVVIPKTMIAEKFRENPGRFILNIKELIGIIDDSNELVTEEFLSMAREYSKTNKEEEDKNSPEGRRASFRVIQGDKKSPNQPLFSERGDPNFDEDVDQHGENYRLGRMDEVEFNTEMEAMSDEAIEEWFDDNGRTPGATREKSYAKIRKFAKAYYEENLAKDLENPPYTGYKPFVPGKALFSKPKEPETGTSESSFKNWKAPNSMLGFISDGLRTKEGLMQRSRATRRKLQDKHIVWRDMQDEIVKHGGKIEDFSDAYNKFTLIEGKIGDRFKTLKLEYVKPLVNELAFSTITIKQLGDYLRAKFAPQRNARIAKINPKMPDGGSGLLNAKAEEILRGFTEKQTKKLESMAQKVYAMQKFKLDILVESGRLKASIRDELLKDDRYVPLKGFVDSSELVTDTEKAGKGFDQAQDLFKRAMGRKSLAADILYTSVRDVESGIISAEKNRVGQSILKLVHDNPNTNLWKLHPIKIQKVFNKRTGQVEQRVLKDYKALARDPNIFITWVAGNPIAIEFLDNPHGESALARAIKNMGVDSIPEYVATLARLNRWLSYANTALSPEFLMTNPIRDIQTAMAKALGDYDGKIAKKVLTNLPRAFRAATSVLAQSKAAQAGAKLAGLTKEESEYANEYLAEGGKTDYFRTKSVADMRNELEGELAAAAKGKKGAAIRAFRALYHVIENGNAVLENMTRLSMYITLREVKDSTGGSKYSKHKAAVAAKNLTVNFQRKGEAGVLLNSLYLFYNASMQGAHLTLRLMKNPKIQKLMITAGAGMVALTQYNILMGGDDDDGEPNYFKNVQPHERERYLIIMWPDGSGRYSKFPLPYGLNVPLNAAATIAHVANGQDPMKEAAWLLGSAWNSFSPVGENGWNIIAPTVIDPFLDIALNRNYADRAIMPARNPFEKSPTPDSQRAFRSTNPAFKKTAEIINELTGGNKQRAGYVDISPESIQHLVETYTGAAGGFLNRTATWMTDPEMETWRKPFIRKFYGAPTKYSTSRRYYDHKGNVSYLKARLDHLNDKAKGSPPDRMLLIKWKEENKDGLKLAGPLKFTERKLRRLYKKRNSLQARPEANKQRIKNAEKEILEAQTKFNKQYNAVFLDRGIGKAFDLLKPN